MNTTRHAARQAEVVAALRPAEPPYVIIDDPADWDLDGYLDGYDDEPDPDPCNHCPHDNADHRGDGCLHCGCDVPQ